jgi:hypothetical protein
MFGREKKSNHVFVFFFKIISTFCFFGVFFLSQHDKWMNQGNDDGYNVYLADSPLSVAVWYDKHRILTSVAYEESRMAEVIDVTYRQDTFFDFDEYLLYNRRFLETSLKHFPALVNTVDEDGNQPLHLAVEQKKRGILKLLLDGE